MRLRARVSDLDPVCASPYRPAACKEPYFEAGHTTAPDHMSLQVKIMLAFPGASTHVKKYCFIFEATARAIMAILPLVANKLSKTGRTLSYTPVTLVPSADSQNSRVKSAGFLTLYPDIHMLCNPAHQASAS